MEERYNMSGSDRQTDEFMKPIIIEESGAIKGRVCVHSSSMCVGVRSS